MSELSEPGRIGPHFKRHPRRDLSPIDLKMTFRVAGRAAGEPWSPGLNVTNTAWRFGARLEIERLRCAGDEVVRRHGILASSLLYQDGGWRFATDRSAGLRVVGLEVRGCGGLAAAVKLMSAAVYEPFRLDVEGPLRIVYVKIAEDDYLIGLVVHHAFADADGVRVCAQELAANYDDLTCDGSASFTEPPLQYLDYMVSLEEWAKLPCAQPSFSYWLKYLDGAQGLQYRPGSGQLAQFELAQPVSAAIRSLCLTEQVGSHLAWEAIHHVTLWSFGLRDVTTLTVSRGRRDQLLTDLVGNFVDLLPTRTQAAPVGTFRQLVNLLREGRRGASGYYPISCNMLAERCSLQFAQLPQFNFTPSGLGRTGVFAVDYPQCCSGRMFDSIAGRMSVPWPDDLAQRLGTDLPAPPSNPYVWVPYVLFVFDRPTFAVNCCGTISMPFTLNGLAARLASMATRLSSDPDQPLATVLEHDWAREHTCEMQPVTQSSMA